MTRLNHVTFQGFTIGIRAGQDYALSCDVKSEMAKSGLHAIKGLVNVIELSRDLGAVGINGAMFISGGK